MPDIEKRLSELERKMNHIDASFDVFREVLIKIQNENVMLRKNRDFLLQKQKEMLKKFPIEKDKLARDIQEKLVEPIREEIKEDTELIKKLVSMKDNNKRDKKSGTDDKVENNTTTLDELFVMVMNNDFVTMKDAAKHFNVHEYQIEEWAKILEDHGLVEVQNNGTSPLIKKAGYK